MDTRLRLNKESELSEEEEGKNDKKNSSSNGFWGKLDPHENLDSKKKSKK